MIGLNDIGSIPTLGILILSYDRIVKMHFGGGLFSFLGGEITLGTTPSRNGMSIFSIFQSAQTH